jgi:1,2-diacylglycerol 3-alpha-glucosyltransferase
MATEYCNLCNAVIAPSESIRDLLERRGVETPITVIPTGIDLDFFASGRRADFRKRWGIAENRRVVGHLGRLAEEKNLIFLAHAVGQFLTSHRDAVFLVVGGGDGREPMKEVLMQYAGDDQLVCVEEPLSGQDLVDAYAAMDCLFSVPSLRLRGWWSLRPWRRRLRLSHLMLPESGKL